LKEAQPSHACSAQPPLHSTLRSPFAFPKERRSSKAAMATAAAQALPASMDAREWDEASYRRGILRARDFSSRTLFRAVFFDHGDDLDSDVLLAAASSDGSLASFSLSSCISAASASSQVPSHTATPVPILGKTDVRRLSFFFLAGSQAEAAVTLVDPVCIVQAHSGPAYDVRFYPDPQQPLLFR